LILIKPFDGGLVQPLAKRLLGVGYVPPLCRRTLQCREACIALFLPHILAGFIASYFYYEFPILCLISAIVIASVMTCGCCCACNFNLKRCIKNKKWIIATLVIMPFVLILHGLIVSNKIIAEVEGGGTAAPPMNATVAHSPKPQMMVDVVHPSGGGDNGRQSLKKTWKQRVWE
jgi:hypothetical protein